MKIIYFETSHTYRGIESVSIKAQTQSRLVSTEEAVKGIGSRIVHNRLTMSKHERGNLKGGSSRVNFSSSLIQLQRLTTSAGDRWRSLSRSKWRGAYGGMGGPGMVLGSPNPGPSLGYSVSSSFIRILEVYYVYSKVKRCQI